MQTRERFKWRFKMRRWFSPFNDREVNRELSCALYPFSLSLHLSLSFYFTHPPRESTFIHASIHSRWMLPVSSVIRILIAVKSQPAMFATWRGTGDMRYISRRERTFAREWTQKWMSSSNGIFEKRELQNDPSIFARVNSVILVSITAKFWNVVYSPTANCIFAKFYNTVYMFIYILQNNTYVFIYIKNRYFIYLY